MMEVPEQLKQLLRDNPPERHTPPDDDGLARGDLRFVRGTGVLGDAEIPRLMLVNYVHDNYAEVTLTHSYVEFVTCCDVVVEPKVAGTPYPVVVESDLRGVVWLNQLGALVGRLDGGSLNAVNRVLRGEDMNDAHVYSGAQLAGVVDPRWGFKKLEGEAFREIVVDCTRRTWFTKIWSEDD